MNEKTLEIIKEINKIDDVEFRERMIIQMIKFNESGKEIECLFDSIKRRLNEE